MHAYIQWHNLINIFILGTAAQEYGVSSAQFQNRKFKELFQGRTVFWMADNNGYVGKRSGEDES